MNTSQLVYFIKVAESGHLTHASEELNLSEPALSKSIARLEDELGANLFDRVGKNIVLNKNGETFLPYARDAVDVVSNGIEAVHANLKDDPYMVTIQCIPLVIFPGLLDQLLDQFPDINIKAVTQLPHELEENLLTGKTDLLLTSASISNSSFNSAVVNTESIVVVFSGNPTLADKPSITPKQLLNERFIVGNQFSGLTRDYNNLFKNEKNKPEISQTLSNPNEVLDYIAHGRGVAAMSSSIYADSVKRNRSGINAIPVCLEDGQPVTLTQKLYWRKKFNTPAILSVKRLIMNYFRNYSSPFEGD